MNDQIDARLVHVQAGERRLVAAYALDEPRDWPRWLKTQADLHNRAADELRRAAEYIDEHNIDMADVLGQIGDDSEE
jgi:hypothetical protein